MTLNELRAAHPRLFYKQSWFKGHAFMDVESTVRLTDYLRPPARGDALALATWSAVDLASVYVKHPKWQVWRSFLWTTDEDDYGQEIYVAGIGQYGINKFQIHRYLKIDERWVTPL